MGKQRKKPWQKTLYGNEGYADNYTDPLFLNDLQKNINVQIFKYSEAILGATKLTHQLSLIVAFLLVFYNLNVRPRFISPEICLAVACGITCFGYFLFIVSKGHLPDRNQYIRMFRDDAKTVLSILVFGYILSPMLHTLTKSISTDTIYTITFFVFFLHLLCFDYGMPASLVSRAISLNAVVFGTICLVSRLETSLDAFVLLIVAVVLFALYPCILNTIELSSWICIRFASVIVVSTITCIFLLMISPILFYINIIVLVFCGFVYPFVFCYAQKYKNNIHGPWDEAVVDVNVNI